LPVKRQTRKIALFQVLACRLAGKLNGKFGAGLFENPKSNAAPATVIEKKDGNAIGNYSFREGHPEALLSPDTGLKNRRIHLRHQPIAVGNTEE
jgi:hypothetical protein